MQRVHLPDAQTRTAAQNPICLVGRILKNPSVPSHPLLNLTNKLSLNVTASTEIRDSTRPNRLAIKVAEIDDKKGLLPLRAPHIYT